MPKLLLLTLAVVTLASGAFAEAQSNFNGNWSCGIECPGGAIEFRLLIADQNGKVTASIINGEEKISVPTIAVENEKLVLDFVHYDSKITAVHKGKSLEGEWRKRRGKDEWVEMNFHASPLVNKTSEPASGVSSFVGKWKVDFAKSEDPAVAVFKESQTASIEGTFLTTTGDYRYLAGHAVTPSSFSLSCFDGAHAFLFKAKRQENGSLKGDFWSSNTWHETWTAKRDSNAKLPDAFKQTVLNKNVKLDAVAFPDLDGKMRKLTDTEFAGKARLIYVFGSWCPNCHDAAAYFADLKKKYKDLSILGLAFELTGDFDRDANQVRRYLKRHNVDYPVLIAGTADKTDATKKLGLLDRVRSYPTTIFVDGKGSVHAVHTGFAGPATGKAYVQLKQKFESTIEQMLKE